MKSLVKMPHRHWYFLLCYLTYSSYTCNVSTLEFLRPKLMIMYHLNSQQIEPFYMMLFQGMITGGILFAVLVNIINYRTNFIWLWSIQILGLVKLFSLSPIIVSTPAIHQLKAGMLLLGIANGGIFSIIHPLIASIYQNPQQSQTKIMNYLHTCWPLLLTITCVFEAILMVFKLDWFWNIYLMLFFSSLFFVIAVFLPLPIQMYAHRISVSTRLKSMLRPGYVLLLFCMVCSAIIQFTPMAWLKIWVENGLKMSPLLFILFINTLQFTVRLFAGPIANRISPPGLLVLGAILSAISLYMLTIVTDTTAILFVLGLLVLSVSWFWPTYIAIVADRYALSGGLGMGLMNVAGFFTLMHIVPELTNLVAVESQQHAFLDLAWFGVFGFILSIGVYIAFHTQGGYKVLSTYDRSL